MIEVRLSTGPRGEFPEGTSAGEALRALDPRAFGRSVAVRSDGAVLDFMRPLRAPAVLEPVLDGTPEGLKVLRHSAAHVMADAVTRLFPEAQYTIGPAIEGGFYYDFEVERPFTPEDLGRIQAQMEKIVQEDAAFERIEVDRPKAEAEMKALRQRYKLEILAEIPAGETVSLYRHGRFTDLCRGPHLPRTGRIGAFKVLRSSGSYWRGSVQNAMLQRIYGTAFFDEAALKEHLRLLEEAEKRDHRRLGKELDLFSFHEEAPGSAFFHPKGATLFNLIVEWWRQVHRAAGYQEVRTPHVLSASLWERSGHLENFKEKMFFTAVEDRPYAIKPMNCPGHCLIFATRLRSYRDLPLRLLEPGIVYRNEKSGELHGLVRVRTFAQDDAHLFCAPENLGPEIKAVLALVQRALKDFGFSDYRVELSTRPEKSMGSDEAWEQATRALREALDHAAIPYELHPGEGAFYGPKIDFHIGDSLKRTWQCGTVQVDFSMPLRFGLTYQGKDGRPHPPVIVHRAIFGSFERFIGLLLEHHAGRLPLWLSPVQAKVLPIGEEEHEYARQVEGVLAGEGFRVEGDYRSEKIGAKIRDGTLEKVPYLAIVGKRERGAGQVSVRHLSLGDLKAMDLGAFVERLRGEEREKS